MTFDRYFRLASSLLVLCGFYAVLIAGAYIVPCVVGMGITVAYGLSGEKLTSLLRIPRWVWNIAALILFAYLFYDTFYGEQDLVGNGIKFVVYLQIVKLLSPKTNRDQMQIYLLSFLHLLSSTVLSSDVTFAFPFLLYIVLATWTLAMFHLKTQQEAAAASEHRESAIRSLLRSKDVITPKFLTASSLLALTLIAFTMLVFFLFPRLSMGQFLRRVTTQQRISGFSENVELGTIGNIKASDTISMRVEFSEAYQGKIDTEYLYWRGTALDAFDGRRWSQSMTMRSPVRIDTDSAVLNAHRATYPGGETFQYRVFLEALSTPLIFGADRLFRVTWDKSIVERFFRGSLALEEDPYLGFHFLTTNNFASDLTYTAESVVGEVDPATLRGESKEVPPFIESTYLQLPKLDPEVKKLIESIPLPPTSLYDQALALRQYIEKNYRYTLDVQDSGTEDPLRFFFIERKRGHCEYFSTALAIALRVRGIPSRQTIGFRGGELNPYGRYLAVRQRDAHSWVEVFFPESGWIRFDPSPLDLNFRTRASYFRKFYQFMDYLRLRWNKYIIEFDLQAQAGIAERIGRQAGRWIGAFKGGKETAAADEPEDIREKIRRNQGRRLAIAVLGMGGILAVGTWIFRRRQRSVRTGKFGELIRLLASHGHLKSPVQTAEEFARDIEKERGSLLPLEELVRLYNEQRFGGRRVADLKWKGQLDALQSLLASSQRTRRRKAGPPPVPLQ
ncbi:MAG TPA: DUF3488 and transglutaminase-like domain-containing protein [Bdellovibrionota bacterium]|nr:DUF3488 and transglutaminase-like domain-containing protein [Bdellovibrionota bacterium]